MENAAEPRRTMSIPVSMAKVGETGVVVRISGSAEVRKFLSDLGFTIGTTISTVSCTYERLIRMRHIYHSHGNGF